MQIFTALDLLPVAHENGFGLNFELSVPEKIKNTAKTHLNKNILKQFCSSKILFSLMSSLIS